MMASSVGLRFCCYQRLLLRKVISSSWWSTYSTPVLHYSLKKPAGGKLSKGIGPAVTKKRFPAETDPEKLVSYVCGSNIYKQGDDVKLRADSEYPDWLWTLRTGKPPPLEDLDPETMEYWSQTAISAPFIMDSPQIRQNLGSRNLPGL